MRDKPTDTLASTMLMVTATMALVLASTDIALAVSSESYAWDNVRIDGGGFVPGIVFNESEPDLIYARTDIGGAYRWNPSTSSWIPLLDWVGWDRWGWNGVVSIASDPLETNRVYVAVGMYTNDWDPNNGAILRSTDKGISWQATELPFKLGGNMPGRGMGERLAIDPNDNSILYFGAMNGNGLWKSIDYGQTWAEVTTFPNPGNWSEDPADPNDYLNAEPGVVWVTFDETAGTLGSPTPSIYVGVADLQNTVYRSTDGGSTWESLAGQPTGFIAHKGQIDRNSGTLYITTSDNGGPYAGGHGDVWKYDIATATWTQISPTPSSDTNNNWYGYSGLSIDRENPGTLMVTGYSSWWPDTYIFRSTDGGATWQSFYDMAYPNRTNYYTQDISESPWLSLGTSAQLPEVTPKLGWMTEALAIDPHNPDRFMYGTGATIYGSNNLTALDSGGTVNITTMVKGLEETAVLDLVSPPTEDAFLFSGLGDIGGFRHMSLTTAPALMYQQPYFNANTSIDYAELNPVQMVRVGNGDEGVSHIAYSWATGSTWYSGSEPSGVTSGGQVALAADGSNVVWSTEGAGVQYATFGGSFVSSTGVPAGARIRSDRVNANLFYAYASGTFYVSTDGGQSFTASGALDLPTENVKLKTVAGYEGHIWLTGDTGLFRSTNSGATFTQLSGVTSSRNVGFGMAAPGATYPAIYLVGTIDGVTGVYRSNDAGAGWVRINDDDHQYGNMGEAITGDPRIYGRVYLGTNGRGILYGDPTGSADTTLPTTPGTPTASNLTSSGADLAWAASTDSGGSGLAGYDVIDASDSVVATSVTSSVTLTGLSASTQYVLRIRARDGAGNMSAPSAAVTFTTTDAPADTTPPTTPGTPTASNLTASGADLAWAASTDSGGSGLAGYDVYERVGDTDTLVGQSTTNSFTLTGLTASIQYTYVVRARDGAGNTSGASEAVTFTTSGTGAAACTATFSSLPPWSGGFQAEIAIQNTGSTAISGWTVVWTFPDGQVISQLWGGIYTQTGAAVSVSNESWNGNLAVGASTSFGFLASGNTTNTDSIDVTCTPY